MRRGKRPGGSPVSSSKSGRRVNRVENGGGFTREYDQSGYSEFTRAGVRCAHQRQTMSMLLAAVIADGSLGGAFSCSWQPALRADESGCDIWLALSVLKTTAAATSST